MDQELPFEIENYNAAILIWPNQGKHILASVKNDTVVVYQAYKPAIAEWVTANQTFKGCPSFSMERMTWIKPSFLWMMYRSGWATKVNQERILAISLQECGFKKLLELCKRREGDVSISKEDNDESNAVEAFGDDDVRIQWDPDYNANLIKLERRAIQLGIRGRALEKFVEKWVVSVSDVTNFVQLQYDHVQNNKLELLQVPVQRVYTVNDANVRNHIGLDDFSGNQ